MKKQFVILIVLSFLMTSASPVARAIVPGFFNPGFAVAGAGTFVGGGLLYLWGKHEAAEGNVKTSIVLRVLGVLAMLTGAVLDEETADKGITYIDMKQDLEQKVEMGIYSQKEADAILSDYTSKWENKALEGYELDIEKKTAEQIQDDLVQKTQLTSLTVGYLLAAAGIQTN